MSHDTVLKLFRGDEIALSAHTYPILDLFAYEHTTPARKPGDSMAQLNAADVRALRDQLNGWLQRHGEK